MKVSLPVFPSPSFSPRNPGKGVERFVLNNETILKGENPGKGVESSTLAMTSPKTTRNPGKGVESVLGGVEYDGEEAWESRKGS